MERGTYAMNPSKVFQICRNLLSLDSFNTLHYYFYVERMKRTFNKQLPTTVLVIHIVLAYLGAFLNR